MQGHVSARTDSSGGGHIDALDRRLVHALQLAPRAPWSALAGVLGADAVTLARRWQRLVRDGVVYVTAVDASADELVIAFLEIDCPPSGVDDVVHILVRDQAVTTVDRTAGDRALMATVFAESVVALGRWSGSVLPRLGAVSTVRSHPVVTLLADARLWRLRALSDREVGQVEALAPAARVTPTAPVMPVIRREQRSRLLAALSDDVRAPASALAERAGMSPRVVGPALAWLLGSGNVSVRVDVARTQTAWPVEVWYFLRARGRVLGRVTQRLRRLPEMRVVATTSGRCDIVTAVRLASLTEVDRFEAELAAKLPEVEIDDRAVVLRTEKHVGHLLDARGRATGTVVPFVPATVTMDGV